MDTNQIIKEANRIKNHRERFMYLISQLDEEKHKDILTKIENELLERISQ